MGETAFSSSNFYLPLSFKDIPYSLITKIHEYIEKYGLIDYKILTYSKNKRRQKVESSFQERY